MIATSRMIVLLTVVGSIAIHTVVLVYSTRQESVSIVGGAPSQVTVLGNGFEDLVDGDTNPVELETTKPVEHDITSPNNRAEKAESANPVAPRQTRQEQISPVTARPVDPSPPIKAEQPAIASVSPSAPAPKDVEQGLVQLTPIETHPLPPTVLDPSLTLPESAKPSEPAFDTRPTEPQLTVTPPAQDPIAPKTSIRPVQRPLRQVGNGQENSIKGDASGQANDSTVTPSSTRSNQSQQAGNAASSNYPGLVRQRLDRATKPRVRGRGLAQVGIVIADDGAVQSVIILQSSGSNEIDRAAVEHVNNAAPFPPPPIGAPRRISYSFGTR